MFFSSTKLFAGCYKCIFFQNIVKNKLNKIKYSIKPKLTIFFSLLLVQCFTTFSKRIKNQYHKYLVVVSTSCSYCCYLFIFISTKKKYKQFLLLKQ